MGGSVAFSEGALWREVQVTGRLTIFAPTTAYGVPFHVDFVAVLENALHEYANLPLGPIFVGILDAWNVQAVELAEFHEFRSDHGVIEFAFALNGYGNGTQPGQRRVADALLCPLVTVHQWSAAEHMLNDPVESLIPLSEAVPRVVGSRFAVGSPLGDHRKHAT